MIVTPGPIRDESQQMHLAPTSSLAIMRYSQYLVSLWVEMYSVEQEATPEIQRLPLSDAFCLPAQLFL